MKSLYERIGGDIGVKAVVIKMYDKILSDPTLNHFFADIDVESLRHSQSAFVTMAFGGPHKYSGKDLRLAHAPFVDKGLNHTHFMAVAEHFKAAMHELQVPDEWIEEAILIVASTHSHVLAGYSTAERPNHAHY